MVAVVEDNICTKADQVLSILGAETAAGACDEDGLAIEPECHFE